MRTSLRLLVGVCLLSALLVPGFGQNQPHRGRISVPFEFMVGATKFPPGQYILDAVTSSYGILRSTDGKLQQALYFMQTGEPEKNPRVTFAVRDKKYYFAAVIGWFGKMQYTGFSPHFDDETKEIPISSAQ